MTCRISRVLYSLFFLIVFTGCNKSTPYEEKSYGDSLIIITHHDPSGINPLTSMSGISSMLTEVVFDGLVRIDDKLDVKPSLAYSWQTSDNGLKWTFFLRSGVKFHDGVEFTAEDVKFTLEEIIHSRSEGSFTGNFDDLIKSIQIKDKYTVEIILNRPSIFFLYTLEVGIVPVHILGEKGAKERFGLHPVGTGPFKLSQWKKDEIVLEANKRYFAGSPYLNEIVVRVCDEQEQAWAKLMRGEGDFLIPINPAVYDFLRQISSIQIYKTHNLHYSMVVLNNNSEYFKDRRVREALNYAIDKDYIIQHVLKGKSLISAGTIWPGSWAYNPSVKPYPYDPQKALFLLKEAGWKDTGRDHILEKKGKKFIFTLFINEGDEIKRQASLYLQQQLWDLGILMNFKTFSTASEDFLLQGKFDAVLLETYSNVYPDFNYNLWHSSQIEKGLNMSRYRSDIADRLLEEGRLSRDKDNAKSIYYKFQEEIHENPPGIFLYWPDNLFGIHRRFRGIKPSPVRAMANIYEWYVPKNEQKFTK